MAVMKKAGLVLALAGVVAAQSSSVVNIFLPGADSQTLLGSIIKSDSSKTTMAIACPTDADSVDCGFAGPITVTVGPSTFHAQESFESTSVVLDCKMTGTTAAMCAETFVGPAGLLATDISSLTASDASFDTSLTTTATTTTLASTDMAYIPITLTDSLGDDTTLSTTAASGASGSASTASGTGSSATQTTGSSSTTSGSSGTSSSGRASPSSDTNSGANRGDSRMLGCAAVGAGLVGLTIMLL
ncbi:hypothetical protein H2202_003144 [Exophiala xenobiotica]|nr:hypothetical protein H2202_003144 [Exophiala xenobiotica]